MFAQIILAHDTAGRGGATRLMHEERRPGASPLPELAGVDQQAERVGWRSVGGGLEKRGMEKLLRSKTGGGSGDSRGGESSSCPLPFLHLAARTKYRPSEGC